MQHPAEDGLKNLHKPESSSQKQHALTTVYTYEWRIHATVRYTVLYIGRDKGHMIGHPLAGDGCAYLQDIRMACLQCLFFVGSALDLFQFSAQEKNQDELN